MHTAGAVAKALIPVIHQADKPVLVSVMGDRLIQEAVEHLRAARIPEYRFPERAAAALSALVERVELLKHAGAPDQVRADVKQNQVRDLLDKQDEPGLLPARISQAVLEAYGIQTAAMHLTENPDQAAAQARELGFPVVLKVASPDISHKTDVGGVLLNLADEHAVRNGFQTITEQARESQPGAEIQGVYVQKMIPTGQEVIVGTVQDPQFGPLVMFGSGGTEVEGLKDIAFGLAPLTNPEVEAMLQETWAGRKLHGYRNLVPADREAAAEVLVRLAQLAADFPRLSEIEINPLRVLPEGQGAVAVDVRIHI
jgi:acetyltransferase